MNKDNRTDEELNRIIAEWDGNPEPHWVCIRCNENVPSSHVTYEETHGIDSCLGSVTWIETPNYCRDLNAVHEAENKLSDNQHKTFRLRLMEHAFTVGSNGKLNAERLYQSLEARQRSEALVRVIEGYRQ